MSIDNALQKNYFTSRLIQAKTTCNNEFHEDLKQNKIFETLLVQLRQNSVIHQYTGYFFVSETSNNRYSLCSESQIYSVEIVIDSICNPNISCLFTYYINGKKYPNENGYFTNIKLLICDLFMQLQS